MVKLYPTEVHGTLYLRIPRGLVRLLDIDKTMKFELEVEKVEGRIRLVYTSV